ncbi:MAG: hypothetical protein J6L47_01410 [Alphaproteobacteria bacterium]|nr:hypothetical protein [Alphaproteobacteria bacterium]
MFFSIAIGTANGASTTPFSQYGQIQNVQTYSSNPFWNPSSPYNQRMPQVIYVNGADMNAGDCQRTVSALIANVCATMNNCAGAQLSDVRPTLMLQLSRLPGHNYATSCAGYIDSEFEKYVKQYGHAGVVSGTVAFPDATTPSDTGNKIEIQNPFEKQTPQWQLDIIERTQELEKLQAQNNGNIGGLEKTSFPTTFADLSFEERMTEKAAGYEPYKDKSAYQPIKIEQKRTATTVASSGTTSGASTAPSPNSPKNSNGTITPPTPDDQKTTLAIFVYNQSNKKPGDEIKLSDISKLYWSDECSDHTIWENLDDDAAINVAGRQVFNKHYLDVGIDKKLVKNLEYFLDFEEGNNRRAFPGLVLIDLDGSAMLITSYNKDTLIPIAKEFASELHESACSADKLAVYVVDTKKRKEELMPEKWWKSLYSSINATKRAFGLDMISDIRKIEIVAGPFPIE